MTTKEKDLDSIRTPVTEAQHSDICDNVRLRTIFDLLDRITGFPDEVGHVRDEVAHLLTASWKKVDGHLYGTEGYGDLVSRTSRPTAGPMRNVTRSFRRTAIASPGRKTRS